MNLIDDSLISAYLDGELDPSRRLTVEAALLNDPKLGERLNELSCVRGFVSGLPRPTVNHDVSGQVLARIDQLPQVRLRRFLRESLRSPRRLGFAASLAATLAMVVSIPFIQQNSDQNKDLRSGTPKPTVAIHTPETKPPSPPTAEPTTPAAIVAIANRDTAPMHARPRSPVPSKAERQAGKDQETLTGVLDRPGVRRILLYVDSLDSRTLDHVESALQKTHRTHPFRARQRVAQSIVIDPTQPNEAVVYTVVLTEPERATLEANLDESLSIVTESDDRPTPELLTRLTEVGELRIMDSPAAPGPIRLNALRTDPEPTAASRLGQVMEVDPGETAGSPLRIHPFTVFNDRPPKNPAPLPVSEEQGTVYLVWVTTRPRS